MISVKLMFAACVVCLANAKWTSYGSKCEIQYEELPTQKCTTREVENCQIVRVNSQKIGYKKVCKDVTSHHCTGSVAYRSKRASEAEPESAADPDPNPAPDADSDPDAQFFISSFPHFLAGPRYVVRPAPFTVHNRVPVSLASEIKPAKVQVQAPVRVPAKKKPSGKCHDVTSEHCIQTPVAVDVEVPVRSCNTVQKVECVPIVEKIPKTVCRNGDDDDVAAYNEEQPSRFLHPFAYNEWNN